MTAARTHQQTQQYVTRFLLMEGAASDGTQRSEMAQHVLPSSHAPRTPGCQGGDSYSPFLFWMSHEGWGYERLTKFGRGR